MNSKRRRSHSPVEHLEGNNKEIEISGRKDDLRDLENDSSNARSGKGHEYVRHSDRHSSGAPRDSRRHDDYRRYHDKRGDDNDRGHRISRSERESRSDTYYDRTKRDGTSDRSRGDWRNDDKSLRREHRSKNQDKQEPSREYPRYDGEHDKYSDGKKQGHTSRRYPEEKESKYKETAKQEEALKKRTGKEIEKMSSVAEPEVGTREKRSLFSSVGPDFENAQLNDNADTSGKKPSLDCSNGVVLDNPTSGFTVNSVDAAKVAAMKAAELVNKNLVGFGVGAGRLSTDQKKKLLWGNKKSNPPESSAHWDSNLFPDRERQEKFNKLMGVKSSSSSSSAQESKVDGKDGSSSDAKKQEELDTDLEKHYIAGLRRRDGRTVGLGL
uniref:Small acidic protein-like domain-containing protein n=1 Tax=Oryza glumipatula TaxID=40148 RepID=A0A0E0BBZ8_9ORYZ